MPLGAVAAAPVAGPPGTATGSGVGTRPPSGEGDDGLVRQLLDRERRRLRALGSAPVSQRRAALADLGSWLAAVDAPDGVSQPVWQELLAELRPERLATEPFEELWVRILRIIDRILETPAESRSVRRPAFWRHHPET
jgi:hypothetical protein